MEVLDDVLIVQTESGEVDKFDERWLIDSCGMNGKTGDSDNDTISVPEVRGIFYILIIAIILSAGGLFYQVCTCVSILFLPGTLR